MDISSFAAEGGRVGESRGGREGRRKQRREGGEEKAEEGGWNVREGMVEGGKEWVEGKGISQEF